MEYIEVLKKEENTKKKSRDISFTSDLKINPD
jgi:hypothetical protein